MRYFVPTYSTVTSTGSSVSNVNPGDPDLINGNSYLKAAFLHVLSFFCSLFTTIFNLNQELHQDDNGEVESGVGSVELDDDLGIETAASSQHYQLQVDEEQIQLSDITIQNHAPLKEVLVEKKSRTHSSEAKDGSIPLEKIGLMVVKIWAIPIASCVATTLTQVILTNQTVISTKHYSLKLGLELLLVTIFSSATLFILSTIQWKFYEKVFIIKSMIVTALASTIVDIVLLVVFGLQFT